MKLNIDEIGEMSNKIAFFIFDDKLITIHRAHFPFLNLEEEKDIKINIRADGKNLRNSWV